jgi:hypothetical protein
MGLALGRNPFLRGSGGDTTPVLVLTACINDFDPVADSIRCATTYNMSGLDMYQFICQKRLRN